MAKSALLTGLEEPWDHVESDNSYDQQEARRRSARDKHPTEKGFEYILNLRRQSAIAAKRSWRKQINLIHSLLVTQKDIATLTAGCEELEKKMTLFSESHEALEAIIDDEEERKLMYEDFEVISRENNGVLRMISEKIKSQEQELDSKSSTTSGSTKTSKISSRSSRKSSRTPPRNSSLSVREKRVQLEGDIASLRATMALAEERQRKELEYRRKMDEVQRKKMEIKREEERAKEELKALEENFRIKQELVQKEAQMIASIKHEEEDNHILLDEFSSRPPTEIGSRSLLEKFLDDQSASVSEANVAHPNQSPILSTHSPPVCESKGKIMASQAVSHASLNPFSPPFKPIYTLANTSLTNPFQDALTTPTSAGVNGKKPKYMDQSLKLADESPEGQVQSKLLEVVKLLAETQNQTRLPLPEPEIFTGDPLQYPIWVKAFETLIEGRAIKPSERLHFLGKYVKGEAKEVVESFLLLDSEDAYDKAKETLKKRFGDPFAVATTCRKKLEIWPKIQPNDSTGLRKYADFLVQCEKIMEKIGSLRVLNDDHENRKLAYKLPRWASNRWSRFAFHWKEENETFPPFSEFVKFVVKEADIACDPVLSSPLPNEEDNGRIRNERNKPKRQWLPQRKSHDASTFKTTTTDENKGTDDEKQTPKVIVKSCIFCKTDHDLQPRTKLLRQFHVFSNFCALLPSPLNAKRKPPPHPLLKVGLV